MAASEESGIASNVPASPLAGNQVVAFASAQDELAAGRQERGLEYAFSVAQNDLCPVFLARIHYVRPPISPALVVL